MDSVLNALQRAVLEGFFSKGGGEVGFFLSGGTALAEYYLLHRESQDLDLFTRAPGTVASGFKVLETACEEMALSLEETRRGPEFRSLVLRESNAPSWLKVDLCLDQTEMLAPVEVRGTVRVDSLLDIAVNKIDCVYSRTTEIKDFIDLYFILHETRHTLDGLLTLVGRKQGAFDLLQFAAQVETVERFTESFFRTVRMRRPLALSDLKSFFLDITNDLFNRLKPPSLP